MEYILSGLCYRLPDHPQLDDRDRDQHVAMWPVGALHHWGLQVPDVRDWQLLLYLGVIACIVENIFGPD